ncbi:hypothetical protein AWV79_04295 [Cupriavidus sp. UYMMa02A]|nr:hypothetical protein AWV79_04295 [Cupriavidus sp. UYMMa02A]
MAAILDLARVSDGGNDCACRDRADSRQRHNAGGAVILLCALLDLSIHFPHPLIENFEVFPR